MADSDTRGQNPPSDSGSPTKWRRSSVYRRRHSALQGKAGGLTILLSWGRKTSQSNREGGSQGVDALSQDWDFHLAYAFPPLVLIPRVLQKLARSDCGLILIAPWWPKRTWFATLKKWSNSPPLRLPIRRDLLLQGPVLHPDPGFLKLTAWFLRRRSLGVRGALIG